MTAVSYKKYVTPEPGEASISTMPISYLQALEIIDGVAQEKSNDVRCREETVSLLDAIGHTLTQCIRSPQSLPSFDTSAMDGYALESALTVSTSPEHPTLFEVAGIVAAGDQPPSVQATQLDAIPKCIEIMTGAQFPYVIDGPQLDACVPIESTQLVKDEANLKQYIKVTRPVRQNQHRRQAGSDICEGEVVLQAGSTLRPQSIMTLAALGINEVTVASKIHVAVCVTGSEIVPWDSTSCSPDKIRDSNGPYIRQNLEDLGMMVTYHPPVPDNLPCLQKMLLQFQEGNDDVLVTTGGVSAGKFDFLGDSLKANGAVIRFHKVAIRPGHPVLFATMSKKHIDQPSPAPSLSDDLDLHDNDSGRNKSGDKAIFGLPGNPIAAAACLQFFVIPLLKRLGGAPFPTPIFAKLKQHQRANKHACTGVSVVEVPKRQIDIFKHGSLQLHRNGYEVVMSDDQASYKTSPIMQSNCWIWMPALEVQPEHGELLPCFPFGTDGGLHDLSSSYSHRYNPSYSHRTCRSAPQQNDARSNTKVKILLLAGGLSTRMKTPKHLLHIGDDALYEILLQQIYEAFPAMPDCDIYISLRDDTQVAELKRAYILRNAHLIPHPIITDIACKDQVLNSRHIGPASGLLSAHDEDPLATWLVIACDYPLINRDALEQLTDEHYLSDASGMPTNPAVTCFINNQGIYQPLLAIWSPEALHQLKSNVARGHNGPSRTIAQLVEVGRCRLVKPQQEEWISNTNTPAEWEDMLELRRKSARAAE